MLKKNHYVMHFSNCSNKKLMERIKKMYFIITKKEKKTFHLFHNFMVVQNKCWMKINKFLLIKQIQWTSNF